MKCLVGWDDVRLVVEEGLVAGHPNPGSAHRVGGRVVFEGLHGAVVRIEALHVHLALPVLVSILLTVWSTEWLAIPHQCLQKGGTHILGGTMP